MKMSLAQLVGKDLASVLADAATLLHGFDRAEADRLCTEALDFFPDSFKEKMDSFLDKVGARVIPAVEHPSAGAPTDSVQAASNTNASPVGGIGYLRLGEDGRLYLASKSEHYHTPLGHNFPGYELIDRARALGVGNATHNNTRGSITRLLERELVRTANGLARGDESGLADILTSAQPHVLNRVINLDTGSLGCEAGIKMMLARFYRLDSSRPIPKYDGRIPVFLVIGDLDGGCGANYHGTTIFAQTFRGMWPELYSKMEAIGLLKVCPVSINDMGDFTKKAERYDKPPYKVAGFLHEIILMNYGGIKLDEGYLRNAYAICHNHDIPVLCDEIQSCMWYPSMYLFREYGLDPDFIVIGKGFPGGQYAASRILTTREMDNLNQFGALVTNGQQELASLAYLITMAYAEENAEAIREISEYYESSVRSLSAARPGIVERVEGKGLLLAIHFHDAETVRQFTGRLNGRCIDVSFQAYKAKCPPAALTKPPIIATRKMVDYLLRSMIGVLSEISKG